MKLPKPMTDLLAALALVGLCLGGALALPEFNAPEIGRWAHGLEKNPPVAEHEVAATPQPVRSAS